MGIRPLARIISHANAALKPEWFTTDPSEAMPKDIAKAGLSIQDIDLFEINEAFSVVALVNEQKLELDSDKVNIRGGAVSMGHPIGCSGARILVTLVHALQQTGGTYGCAGICKEVVGLLRWLLSKFRDIDRSLRPFELCGIVIAPNRQTQVANTTMVVAGTVIS